MPKPTEATHDTLIRLLQMPQNVKVWVHHGDTHEEVQAGPGNPNRVWWEGLTLKARIKVAYPNADFLEFRDQGEAIWIVPIKAGARRAFTFQQTIGVGAPKVGYLSA